MCSARPAAVPPPWDPARGCIEGIELLKSFHSAILAPRCRTPCRICTPRPPSARDRCLRWTKAINTKFEITFVRVRDSSIHKSEGSTKSDFVFSIYSLG